MGGGRYQAVFTQFRGPHVPFVDAQCRCKSFLAATVRRSGLMDFVNVFSPFNPEQRSGLWGRKHFSRNAISGTEDG